MKYRVYVSGPISKGNLIDNIRNAIVAGDKLLSLGYAPYIPHLDHLWSLISPKAYEILIENDFEWIRACHTLLRLPGESSGGDREVAFALGLGIPVFYGIEALDRYFHEKSNKI